MNNKTEELLGGGKLPNVEERKTTQQKKTGRVKKGLDDQNHGRDDLNTS